MKSTTQAPRAAEKPSEATPSDAVNSAILAVIRTSVLGRRDALAHRRALQDKARLLTDVDHFSRLCISDLRAAFNDDRAARSRMTKNRRRTWLAMFRHYAKYAGIQQDIRIIALDRQGNYACELIDKVHKDNWQRFVQLGRQFDITEATLLALCAGAQAMPAGKMIPHQSIAAPALVARRPLTLLARGSEHSS